MRRHLIGAHLAQNLFPGGCVRANAGQVPVFERNSARFGLIVVAADAVLVYKGLRPGLRRSGKKKERDSLTIHLSHYRHQPMASVYRLPYYRYIVQIVIRYLY
jgi:hypothetical protein